MSSLSKLSKIWLSLLSLLALAGLSAVLSTIIVERHPGSFPGKVLRTLAEHVSQAPDYSRGGGQIETGLLELAVETVDLPPARRVGEGGGLAQVGDKTAVLLFDGSFFLLYKDGSLHPAPLTPPDNHFADYQADAETLDGYRHAFRWYRYHDLAYYRTATRHGLLVSMTRYDKPQRCYVTVVAQWDLAQDTDLWASTDKAAWQDLFVTEPCLPLKKTRNALEGHMAGGRMLVDATGGKVILATGDYHWDGTIAPLSAPGSDLPLALDPGSDYGKLIAIDLLGGDYRHLSRGHRNPQGLARDQDGTLWAIEHGPLGGDEINRIVDGGSYGWPEESFGDPTYHGRYQVHPNISDEGFGHHQTAIAPAMAWSPSVAPSSLSLVSDFHPAWDGDFLMGAMSVGGLIRLRLQDGTITGVERISFAPRARIRDVLMRDDGKLVLLTRAAQLLLLSPLDPTKTEAALLADGLQTLAPARRDAAKQALLTCLDCHRLGRDQSGTGPSLSLFYGAGVGQSAFSSYSDALKADGRAWTPQLLSAYLANPQAVVAGTLMPNPGLEDAQARQDLVDLLIALNAGH